VRVLCLFGGGLKHQDDEPNHSVLKKKRYELDHLSRLSLDHIGHNLDLVQAWMVRDWWVQAELKTHSQSAAGLNRLRISIHRVPTMIFDFPSDPTSPATYVFES
jgi:hypothetical protein